MRFLYSILPLLLATSACLAMVMPEYFNLPFEVPLLSQPQREFFIASIASLGSLCLIIIALQYLADYFRQKRLTTALKTLGSSNSFKKADLEDFKAIKIIDGLVNDLNSKQKLLQGSLSKNFGDISKARDFSEGLSLETRNQKDYLEKIALTLQAMTLSTDSIVAAVNKQNQIIHRTQDIFSDFNQSIQGLFSDISAVNKMFGSTLKLAQQGGEIVKRSVESLNNINQSAREIEVISGIINDISDRTNLLSLNATIEAARAGEHGTGFAVVADEISKLADQSSQSVQKITDLIDKNIKFSSAGKQLAGEARQGFEAIQKSIGKMNETLQTTNEHIAAEKTQINSLMAQISDIESESKDIQLAIEKHATESQNILDSVQVITETTNSITVGIRTIFEMLSDMQAGKNTITA